MELRNEVCKLKVIRLHLMKLRGQTSNVCMYVYVQSIFICFAFDFLILVSSVADEVQYSIYILVKRVTKLDLFIYPSLRLSEEGQQQIPFPSRPPALHWREREREKTLLILASTGRHLSLLSCSQIKIKIKIKIKRDLIERDPVRRCNY